MADRGIRLPRAEPGLMADDPHLAAMEAIRSEMEKLRLQQARTMALLLGMAKPMTAEATERLAQYLMALDGGGQP
jgi:hypothetical protein